jgi:DNA-binding response OmpR family regulator
MRLLLVEDDPMLASLILEGLGEDGLSVEHAPNATLAQNMAELGSFDALILDVMLPEGDRAGFELARTLREARNSVPILFLTARADMDSKLHGLELGGDDYLTKPFDFRELRVRVRSLVRRAGGNASNVLTLAGGCTLDLNAHRVGRNGKTINLTPLEYALIECFALNPGRAYSRETLIERVWGGDSSVDTKAVDVYISSVRRKLGEAVIETVRGLGYRLGYVAPGSSGGTPPILSGES